MPVALELCKINLRKVVGDFKTPQVVLTFQPVSRKIWSRFAPRASISIARRFWLFCPNCRSELALRISEMVVWSRCLSTTARDPAMFWSAVEVNLPLLNFL